MTDKLKKDDEANVASDIPSEAFEEALKAIERLESQAKAERVQTAKPERSAANAAAPKPAAQPRAKGAAVELDDFNRLMSELTDQLSRDRDGLEVELEAAEEPRPAAPPRPAPRPIEPRPEPVAEKPQPAAEVAPAAQQDEPSAEQLKEFTDRLQRVQAEFENYRKRMAREREDAKRFYNEELLRQLLPVLDNLQRAFDHAREQPDKQALQDGVELILNQLRGVISGFGIEELSAVGQMFDPTRHEAMVMVEEVQARPGTVLNEFRRGYLLNGRLLRPAQVVVARAPGATSAPSTINGGVKAEQTAPEQDESVKGANPGSSEAGVPNDIENR